MVTPTPLSLVQLKEATATLAQALEALRVKYGIIGGAGVCLVADAHHLPQPRQTADIDLVVQPNPRTGDEAESVSKKLLSQFPQQFAAVYPYGVSKPAIRVQAGSKQILVEVEIFDVVVWPQRQQYNLDDPANRRVELAVNGHTVHVLGPVWILREKILSQHERAGNRKEHVDIVDIEAMLPLVGSKELKIGAEQKHLIDALKALLLKRPDLKSQLSKAVECNEVLEREEDPSLGVK